MMIKLGFEFFFTVQYFNECKKARARFSGKTILTSSSTTEAAAEAEVQPVAQLGLSLGTADTYKHTYMYTYT